MPTPEHWDDPLSLWEGVAAGGVMMMMYADEERAPAEDAVWVEFLRQQGLDPETAQAVTRRPLQIWQEAGGVVLERLAYQAVAATSLAVRIALADGFVLLEENTVLHNLRRGLGVSESRLAALIQGELGQDERFRPLVQE